MRKREELFAIYIIDNKCTIRKCAENFNIGKSTVHNDISKKLKITNKFLYYQVYKILNLNYKERHIRGGLATKEKYAKLKIN
ncbi:MAG: stage III sporulation protein D [Clostridiales bacterium]|nr:stage III sporulation protein D [Clostridiales bacterium]